MAISRERILDALARLPFIDAGELSIILGEPLATVHRVLTALLKDGVAQRVSHGTAHLPSSYRYYLTGRGIAAAADALGYDAPSEFVQAYTQQIRHEACRNGSHSGAASWIPFRVRVSSTT